LTEAVREPDPAHAVVDVRYAVDADRRPLALLFAAVAEERDGIAAEPPIDVEKRAANWDLDRTFVALAAGEVVGLLFVIESSFGFGEIGMMVALGWRGRGVGTSDVPSGAISTETDTPSWSGSPAAYSYDAQSRVTQMTPGSGSALNYAFDASGSPTTLPTGATGSYDNAAELTSSTLSGTTTTYTYDADGQRTQANQSGTTIASASYDGAQRLTAYSNSAANMSAAAYDGDGLRQSTTTTPAGGTATTENFAWNPSTAVPQLLMDSDNAYLYGAGSAPLEQVNLASGAVKYLVSDLLGSVRGIVSASGTLIASTAYDAWGNPETTGGLSSYTPFGYAGGYTDPTGLSYLIHRYYDPSTGQFLSVDPLVDETTRPYAYADDDPVNAKDPGGAASIGIDAVLISTDETVARVDYHLDSFGGPRGLFFWALYRGAEPEPVAGGREVVTRSGTVDTRTLVLPTPPGQYALAVILVQPGGIPVTDWDITSWVVDEPVPVFGKRPTRRILEPGLRPGGFIVNGTRGLEAPTGSCHEQDK
jgi:RHS repeat-associated protein